MLRNMAYITEHNFKARENYTIKLPTERFILVRVPVLRNSACANFDHDNICLVNKRVMGFKHWNSKRGKYWTYKAGLEFFFYIHRSDININTEESGHSYIHTIINGMPFVFTVSGGSSANGWTDVISQGVSTLIITRVKDLKVLAEIAWPEKDISPKSREMISSFETRLDSATQIEYQELCDKPICQKNLKEGCKLVLKSHFLIGGSNGPFVINRKTKRSFICLNGIGATKVSYKHIDWIETAKENGWQTKIFSEKEDLLSV